MSCGQIFDIYIIFRACLGFGRNQYGFSLRPIVDAGFSLRPTVDAGFSRRPTVDTDVPDDSLSRTMQ